MDNNLVHSETNALSTVIDPALKGLVVTAHTSWENSPVIAAYRVRSLEIATYLKLSSLFSANNPLDCYVIDRLGDKYRFTIVYTVQSFNNNYLVRIITKTNDVLPLVSLQGVYPSLNWAEREVWDMSGVFFVKHPDLRRILTDYGFSGHPLRKDFPLSGFREVHYEDSTKHIEYDALELSQNYRVSNLLNPWANEKKV